MSLSTYLLHTTESSNANVNLLHTGIIKNVTIHYHQMSVSTTIFYDLDAFFL